MELNAEVLRPMDEWSRSRQSQLKFEGEMKILLFLGVVLGIAAVIAY